MEPVLNVLELIVLLEEDLSQVRMLDTFEGFKVTLDDVLFGFFSRGEQNAAGFTAVDRPVDRVAGVIIDGDVGADGIDPVLELFIELLALVSEVGEHLSKATVFDSMGDGFEAGDVVLIDDHEFLHGGKFGGLGLSLRLSLRLMLIHEATPFSVFSRRSYQTHRSSGRGYSLSFTIIFLSFATMVTSCRFAALQNHGHCDLNLYRTSCDTELEIVSKKDQAGESWN